MIENHHIKSIKSYNNHLLLTVYPQSSMKLSGFVFELDETEYNDAFYNAKGYLELYSLTAVEKFIKVNAKHLSTELQQSIQEDAQNHFNNLKSTSVNNRRLSFFHAHQEKIPLIKLEKMREWVKDYNPSGSVSLVMDAFNNVFRILFPPAKRQKLPNSPFYEVFESEGKIEIESLKGKIGKAWSQFYKFQILVSNAINYPSSNLKKISIQPELLGHDWDILNKEKFTRVLQEWLQSILDTKVNPIDNQLLSEEELNKLKNQIEFIKEAFSKLPKEDNTKTCDFSI